MEKLYDKLFSDDSDNDDIIIYNNCCKASLVELKHFIKGKDDYILENFIPDTNHYFQQINKEKSLFSSTCGLILGLNSQMFLYIVLISAPLYINNFI